MNIPDYRIEPADYRADFNDLRAVRESVFVIEQNIPLEIEFDDIDPQCHHVIARDAQHQPLGTARLTPEHKIGRMAVISERRNQGIGKALLLALIDKAGKLGWTEVAVNAQLTVLGFYEKLGFTGYGEVFDEAGISHQAMRLTFQPVAVVSRPAPKPRSASVKPLEFNTLEAATAATLQLITQARRQLCIISHGLDYDLYAQKEIMDAFKQFAIHSRDGCAQIIIQDATLARSRPHPLLDLAQRLPSTLLFRSPIEPEDIQYPSAFLINDRGGYLFRLIGDQYQGNWSPVLPARTRQLSEDFERIWQRSEPCVEFRVLSL